MMHTSVLLYSWASPPHLTCVEGNPGFREFNLKSNKVEKIAYMEIGMILKDFASREPLKLCCRLYLNFIVESSLWENASLPD